MAEKKTKAPAAAAAKKPRTPRVKDWTKTAGYRDMRKALTEAVGIRSAVDPLVSDKVEEYMNLWCQRQMLYDDVRKRGPTVADERGRVSENRSISLGVQVSKQMLALCASLGLGAPQEHPKAQETEEDDEL